MACNKCGTVYGPTVFTCPKCGSGDVGRAEIMWPTDAAGRARKAQVEKEVAQAFSTSTSSVSGADTKPSSTLEENIEATINKHQDWGFDETNMKEVVQALLSLYQKELVRELKAIRADLPTGKPDNPTEFERASYMMATDLAEQINNRIKLTGEQP